MLSEYGVYVYAVCIFVFLTLLVWAAIEDYRAFKIPNVISLALVAFYPVYVLSSPEPVAWTFSLAMAGIVLVMGFAFFAFGVFGAGDAKLLAATVLWIEPAHFVIFLAVWVIATLLLVLVIGFSTAMQLETATDRGGRRAIGALGAMRFVPFRKLVIPYGVAIAAGGGATAVVRLSGISV